MRLIARLGLALLAARILAAPAVDLDRLQREADTAPPERRFEALLRLFEHLERLEPDRREAVAQQLRAAARTPHERLRTDLIFVGLQRSDGDYDGALAAARAGVERATALGDDALRAEFLLFVARTHWNRSDLPAALETYFTLLPLAEARGDPHLLARVHNGLANTQATAGQWERARTHYETARRFAIAAEDNFLLADILNNLGNFHYNRRRDFAAARELHAEAVALREALGHRRGMADSQLNLGNIAAATGDYAEAIARFERAREAYEALGLKRNLANALRSLGAALRNMNRTQEAVEQLQRARELAEALGSAAVQVPIYSELSLAYEALGDWKTAVEFERRHAAANEAMLDERTRQRILTLNQRKDAERHEQQLELLRREQAVQQAELVHARRQRYGLLALLTFGAVSVVALVSRHRVKLAAERRVLEETRSAKQAAEQAAALKTRLVSIASHDLKSPLRGIVSGADAIARHPRASGELAAQASTIASEGERLLLLIRDLLDMTALEARQMELQCRPVTLARLAREALAAATPRAQAKQQALVCAIAPEAETASTLADAPRLRQAIDNLIDNAIKFTPIGGKVEITLSLSGGLLHLAVQDAGPGFVAEDFARMFAPFQTLSATPTGGESSTGLGLFIAREIATLHGGQIVVQSVPRRGATVTLLLPASREPIGKAALEASLRSG